MNFNKTTEYALRILSYMATDEAKLYSADEIFQNLKIPYRYLRKQLTILSKSGLMISVQGIRGGYRLAKPNKDISLLDIVTACGEDFISDMCFFGMRECSFGQKCAMHDKWDVVKDNIRKVLGATTLADLKIAGPPNFKI
jgi:Rrf2 family transcriptional regulator, nitric oxide-sensitive transcriptional repressor